jgi:predicted DCC family thiol-disulfide oxidoreductase YuxK
MGQSEITVLIDGACPLCRREADLWRWLDRGRGRVALEDINSPDFDPVHYGLTRVEAMGRIHGVLPTGVVISGMEVFRRAYAAVGWGWLAAPTGWPVLRPLFDRTYQWFARNRLKITGRLLRCVGTCSNLESTSGQRANPPRFIGGTGT